VDLSYDRLLMMMALFISVVLQRKIFKYIDYNKHDVFNVKIVYRSFGDVDYKPPGLYVSIFTVYI
jgi:hypothetical protein